MISRFYKTDDRFRKFDRFPTLLKTNARSVWAYTQSDQGTDVHLVSHWLQWKVIGEQQKAWWALLMHKMIKIWAQLFKTNDVVS